MGNPEMTELNAFLLKLHKNLAIFQEREANFGSNIPLDLINQISNHKEAIALTEQVRCSELSETEWQEGILPLALSSDLLEMAARITPDLRLHEQAYQQRLKERYAEKATYFVELISETQIVSKEVLAPDQLDTASLARFLQSNQLAEYHE
jgi:hypothetical protein